MTHITCRLTAKNRDQLRNPTLGNRVWATFTFLVPEICWRTYKQTDRHDRHDTSLPYRGRVNMSAYNVYNNKQKQAYN